MKQGKIIDLEVDRWITETDRAWLLIVNGQRVWLPKSQVEFDEADGVISIPESLAIDRELI